jgi:predicted AAA+ superfamily ATPase
MDAVKAMCSESLACFAGLSVFNGVRKAPVIRSLERVLAAVENANSKPMEFIEIWADFSGALMRDGAGRSFFRYWTDLILTDENIFTLNAERGDFNAKSLLGALVSTDLKRLAIIGDIDIPMIALYITDELWKTGFDEYAKLIEMGVREIGNLKASNYSLPTDALPYGLLVSQNVDEFASYMRTHGAGKLGLHHFFSWRAEEGLVPARNPDTIRLSDLAGYEEPRQLVVENTRRLLEGAGANNLLLYGDRGTGKSATVKAVCNEYKERGLRLIEVRKRDLSEISRILPELSRRGLYFVLFIDDLSFERQDDDFTELKALLEGGIEAKAPNVTVYATSNRRHFVKERFSERPMSAVRDDAQDDVRAFDTMQEQLSLADRFGITVIFSSPSQDEFLHIAEFLAEKAGLFDAASRTAPLDRGIFRANALIWERWFNGRSARTARQFVDWAAGGAAFPWE